MKRYIFPDPLDATCKLQPDSMTTPIVGVADTHPSNGAACQSFNVPSTVPNKNGATLTIEKPGFSSLVLHGILDTITTGGGGFECDVFKLPGCCRYAVMSQSPVTFDANGGTGSFTINTTAQCKWDADEDTVAEDFVKVAGGTVVGSGTKTFTVFSETQAPQPPLPRSGYINIFDVGAGGALVTKVFIVQQK